MRNHLKTLQNYNYVNMYIVYCDNMRNITTCDPRKGIIRYRVALFLFALFRNILQYISKYFEIYFEIFQKKCMPKSFERFRINRNSFEIFQYAISFKRFHIFILLMYKI